MNRFELLTAAADIVADRGKAYGTIWENHERIAIIWTAILGVEITPEQVVACMIGTKLARIAQTQDHMDSWIDIAGYAACGSELVDERQKTDDTSAS